MRTFEVRLSEIDHQTLLPVIRSLMEKPGHFVITEWRNGVIQKKTARPQPADPDLPFSGRLLSISS